MIRMYENRVGESVQTSERGSNKSLEERSGSGCCPVANFFEFNDEHLNAIKQGIF